MFIVIIEKSYFHIFRCVSVCVCHLSTDIYMRKRKGKINDVQSELLPIELFYDL